MKRFLFVFSSSPYSTPAGQEGLDAALSAASLDIDVALLFTHDGVFQVKSEQGRGASQLKQYTKSFKALADFGIEETYVDGNSMQARGLGLEQIFVPARSLDVTGVASLIAACDEVFTF